MSRQEIRRQATVADRGVESKKPKVKVSYLSFLLLLRAKNAASLRTFLDGTETGTGGSQAVRETADPMSHIPASVELHSDPQAAQLTTEQPSTHLNGDAPVSVQNAVVDPKSVSKLPGRPTLTTSLRERRSQRQRGRRWHPRTSTRMSHQPRRLAGTHTPRQVRGPGTRYRT